MDSKQTSPSNHILIVDDDPVIRDTMHEFIERSGYSATKTSNARTALTILEKKDVAVVITDIIMPGMDGLQLTDHIRRHHRADVIVMTGFSGEYSYEEAIQKGASDFVFKPVRFEELLLRLRRVMRERTLSHEREEMLAELQTLAITDGLTQLYNSRHFYNQLEAEIDRSIRYSRPLALILLDIDYFKRYNDSYGHLKGDEVLVRMGQVIRNCLRAMDSAYRYGGEEFTILLPETTCEEAILVAQRLNQAMAAETFNPEEETVEQITISAGVTEYFPGEDISVLVQRADQAMYTSKKKGRNRVSSLTAIPADQ